jgi:hypothetical protein
MLIKGKWILSGMLGRCNDWPLIMMSRSLIPGFDTGSGLHEYI